MGRVVEVVLDIPVSVADEGLGQREREGDAQTPDRLGAALIQALDALPQTTRARAGEDRLEVCCFDNGQAMSNAGWQISIEDAPEGRQFVASRVESYSPGVTMRDTMYETSLATAELTDAALDDAPGPLKHALARAGNLEAVARLEFDRTRWQWRASDDVPIDIVLDCVAGLPTPTRLYELRVSAPWPEPGEAAQPLLDALFAAARELVGTLPAFPVLLSATERACRSEPERAEEPVRAAPIDLADVDTPHEALRAIGHNIAQHWFGNEAGVRDAAVPESVHQMRVAQRRLKTALTIFPHWVDEAWSTRIAPDLTWLGGLLGEARDRDVFTDATLPALAAADTDPERWGTVCDAASAQRLEARTRAQEALRSRRYAQLSLAWMEWLSALASRDTPAGVKARTLRGYARKRVRKYYRRVASAPRLTTLDDATRHRERIQAKRLRYTLEFFAPIVSHKTRSEVAKTVSRIQTVLGEGNDAVVALRYLEQLDLSPYQQGFTQGWSAATRLYTAREGERLLRTLKKPKIGGGE
ncbi:CHAD domain-containing protein [Paraburkholderia sp. BL10I2N1]|uniref:CHAD domain-containing protein n=1 Tax=Paraburkholderia sp. BL10I2N1 TaxID=1938796 RepID=UPI001060DA44|nr:CHAD domain-containing protein [Paraburkholderia sp. BL10I2N1]TDN62989.1 CHAD domain-containing protein [Paraburkholderia sp. BL10I2N1]